jgi:catechol 2,3-dioxygenase-like lactoylglutathione lyase family enzyme
MKPNIHLHLIVADLTRSAAFYELLFGTPVKVKDGYRKFLPEFAPLNLALSERRAGVAAEGTVSHLGIQFETSEEVRAQLARVKSLGLPVREEVGVACCHANQDKFWVKDPDGLEWELYKINFDIEEAAAPPDSGCCPTTTADAANANQGCCAP